MKLLLAGCTGFIGKELIKNLEKKGHKIILLSRDSQKYHFIENENISIKSWDGKTIGEWANEVENIDGIINLSGESVVKKRWDRKQKEILRNSRIDSTKVLIEAIKKAKKKPKVLINASAVGFYGDVKDGEVGESSPMGKGFLAKLCSDWEGTALSAKSEGLRVVILRIGVVLEKEGGAIKSMLPPFLMFAGGPLGSGKQWLPWIHRDDVVNIIIFSLENERIDGPINVSAPEIVDMNSFCSEFGKVLKRPSWAPVPGFGLKILLGEMSDMLLSGQKATPKKLISSGYNFKYPKVNEALKAIFS